MGIRNFLAYFKKKLKKRRIEEFSGKTVGIDGYVWMHKAVYAGLEFAYRSDGTKYVDYFMNNLSIFTKNNVKPVVIFDGDEIFIKKKENSRRKAAIEAKCRSIAEFQSQIDPNSSKDKEKLFKMIISTVKINATLVKKVIDALKQEKIEYIVSPYEADAELAYLSKIGYINAVVTEDSDLCAYGVDTVIYKFERNGNCMTLEKKDYIRGFETYDQFLECCVLAGCDFFRVGGISLATAVKLITKYKYFPCIPASIIVKKSKDLDINGIMKMFYMAKYVFINQVVYCPITRIMMNLGNTNLLDDRPAKELEKRYFSLFERTPFLRNLIVGEIKDGATAMLIAKGKIDPITGKEL